jgi:hypothetical protein
VAATGALALPVVLPLLLSQALAGRRLSSAVAALVSALYAQERLDAGVDDSMEITVDTLVTRS